MAHDILTSFIGDCGYPRVCGDYGICNVYGKCVCPDRYFNPIDDSDPRLGCSERIPLSCAASQFQTFLEVGSFTYFAHGADPPGAPSLGSTDMESCKTACANNCSCRAAFFQSEFDDSHYSGSCYLVSEVFSLTYPLDLDMHYFAFLKVQNPLSEIQTPQIPIEPPVSSKNPGRASAVPIVIIISSLGSLLAFIFLLVVVKCLFRNKGVDEVEEDKGVDEVAEDFLDWIPGAPKRFTYDDLKEITEDFSKTLGEGGFSSVYLGTLANGTKVAVKHLNGSCQTKKYFLAEVESIGNIHHVNLVRLLGFCAENFHRLLVYEYMSKGSLDKWIFRESEESFGLDWQRRRNIICDIAKGLSYLHEECRWKIIHMDIKPQNILLDEKFNAKVADFGLSKLIDRDQSQIVTTMRGTPGYLAPEWLHAAITEKVDVYSFGVVILEIICGRKVFDESQDEEDIYLLGVFKRKSEERQLMDLMDKNGEDMHLNTPHVVNMMRLAAWCLKVNFTKRPSMPTVIKVLEGVTELPDDLDYNFSYPILTNVSVSIGEEDAVSNTTGSVVPSILSGPR